MGKIYYLLDLHDGKRVYHVNLLKKRETPVTDRCVVEVVSEEEEEFPDWKTGHTDPRRAAHLVAETGLASSHG